MATHGDDDFRGSLCLWFRPSLHELQLQPIIAASKEVDDFEEDPPSATAADGSLRPMERPHLPMALAFLNDMVPGSVPEDSDVLARMTFDEIEKVYKRQWPTYVDFWIQTLGQETYLIRAGEQVASSIKQPLTSGILVTRAQVARIDIERTSQSTLEFQDERMKNIGHAISDHDKIFTLLKEGQKAFDCMALSVSNPHIGTPSFETGHDPRPHISFKDCNKELLNPAPMVNVLILKREADRCLRIGFGQVFLKCWLRQRGSFQVIVLA